MVIWLVGWLVNWLVGWSVGLYGLCIIILYSHASHFRAHLGRDVRGRPDGALRLRVEDGGLGVAKVADLEARRGAAVEERVLELEVAVADAPAVAPGVCLERAAGGDW